MSSTRVPLSLLLAVTLLSSGCGHAGKVLGTAAAALSGQEAQQAAVQVRSSTDPETVRKAKLARSAAIRAACGKTRDRGDIWRAELAAEIAKLPPEFVRIIEALNDGHDARDGIRKCRGEL